MKRELEHFSGYLALERGLAPNSVAAYMSDLRDFSAYLEQSRGADFDPNTITRDDIISYLGECKIQRDLQSSSLARRLIALKIFFRYLFAEKCVDSDITDVMDSPKIWRLLPDFLSMEEMDRFLLVWEDPAEDDPFMLRNAAILEVLYSSGLRVSEAADLRLTSLFFDEGFLRVTGKGDKERIVPIGDVGQEKLRRYLAKGRPRFLRDETTPYVFLSKSGVRLDRERIWGIVKETATRAGIMRDVHPHTLRHCFASHLLENGADLRVIQEMLGHADISTTQIYTHIDTRRLLAAHKKFFPRS